MILSTSCLKESPSQREPANPCSECIALSKCRISKNALNRDLPKQENLKFTPYIHRAQTSSSQCAKMVGVHEIFQKATAVRQSCFIPFYNPHDTYSSEWGGSPPTLCPWDTSGGIQWFYVWRNVQCMIDQDRQRTSWGWNAGVLLPFSTEGSWVHNTHDESKCI